MPEFQAFPKIPRLFRNVVITEKIDGTNAAVGIIRHPDETPAGSANGFIVGEDEHVYEVYAQSRNRLITPENDNYGFARWVQYHAGGLADDLGEGLHFGEWWGQGIQRGYGLAEKRFSLFNTLRWKNQEVPFKTPGLGVVPVLSEYSCDTEHIQKVLGALSTFGSMAAPGYMNPEGIVVFHTASRQVYKVTLEMDGVPKSVAKSAGGGPDSPLAKVFRFPGPARVLEPVAAFGGGSAA